jgi:transcription elongation factor SPT5
MHRAKAFGILSIFTVPLFQNCIFVETTSIENVQAACKGLWYVSGAISRLSLEESVRPLQMSPAFSPKSRSWIRIARPPLYRGDLAFILDADLVAKTLHVVFLPRIRDPRPAKRPTGKSKQGSRPAQALFNPTVVQACHGERSVKQRGQTFVFDGMSFKDGFVSEILPISKFFPNVATPTVAELNQFQAHPTITLRDVGLAYFQRIAPNDNVKVVAGELKGLIGKAVTCEEYSIVVEYTRAGDTHPSTVTLPPRDIRKRFSVGDHVQIVFGPYAGITGWVIGEVEMMRSKDNDTKVVEDQETIAGLGIHDEKNMRSVCHLLFLTMDTLLRCVVAHCSRHRRRILQSRIQQAVRGHQETHPHRPVEHAIP